MKAIAKTKAAKGFELIDVPIPQIKDNEMLVKVKYASICGTDLHIYHWNEWSQNRIKVPRVVGHEFVGEIVETGKNVKAFKTGEMICSETHIYCGHCYECHTGLSHICHNLEILGIDRDGTFAEYVVIPEIVAWKVPKEIPLEVASCLEPIGNAVHTAFAAPLSALRVLVTGCGPIGLASIAIAKACGATYIAATDVNDYRLDLAKKLGANLTINVKNSNVVKEIYDNTDGEGVDVVMEMSGNPAALQQGIEVVRKGGYISLLGLFDKAIEVDMPLVIEKELVLKGIHGRKIFTTWHQANNLITSGLVNLAPLITHKLPIEKFEEGFQLMDSGNCSKVLLMP